MKPLLSKTITIALCGSQPRVGTTSQAFQIVQYLQMRGYAVAYIDLAGMGYIDQLCKLYGGVEKSGNCVIYEEIHMYRTVLDLNEDYQYLIKDYGSVKSENFNEISYLEQDLQIVCSGVKPNEIFEVVDILKKQEFNHAKFIFSFVPPDHRSGILKQMTNRAENTFFAGYNPDPFSYDATNNKAFRHIIGTLISESSTSVQPVKKNRNIVVRVCMKVKNFIALLRKRIETPYAIAAALIAYTLLLMVLLLKFGFLRLG